MFKLIKKHKIIAKERQIQQQKLLKEIFKNDEPLFAKFRQIKWRCPNDDGTNSLCHPEQCVNCWGECHGILCVDCCQNEYEGWDEEEANR